MKFDYLWKARKRNSLGLPWTFTVYSLSEDKLFKDTGFLNKKYEEVLLYRIVDLSVRRSLLQRLFGLGTVHCCTTDKSTPELDLENIKNSMAVKELISKASEDCKVRKGYTVREFMGIADDELGNEHD